MCLIIGTLFVCFLADLTIFGYISSDICHTIYWILAIITTCLYLRVSSTYQHIAIYFNLCIVSV